MTTTPKPEPAESRKGPQVAPRRGPKPAAADTSSPDEVSTTPREPADLSYMRGTGYTFGAPNDYDD
jgi:hypothetical protein